MKSKRHKLSAMVFYSVIIAVALVLPNMAFALQSGDFTYTVSGGTVTITRYIGAGGDVVIPSSIDSMPVVSIGNYAFEHCTGSISVTIPSSVTSIGDFAFQYCTGSISVTIPDSVTSIGDGAFSYCTGLTSLTIPSSVTSIGDWAFYGCSSLTDINVDANSSSYSSQDGVLYNKAKTTLFQYPAGKTGGFIIPSSVTSIGIAAFVFCTNLTSVTIGNGVTSIGSYAFSDCSGLTSVTIPNSVTSIENYTFYGCRSLTSVTIPDSVTRIEDSAFYECYGLTSVTIGNSVTSIGGWAFRECTSLPSVTIPDSVTTIGNGAFSYCTGLAKAYFLGNAPWMGESVFDNCAGNFQICYTAGSTGFVNTWHGYATALCTPDGVPFTFYDESQDQRIAALEAQLAAVTQALQNCGCVPTNINLSSLKALPSNKIVTLKWQTESETDNAGFNIWRAEGFVKVNNSVIPALGSPVTGSDYDFVDQWVLNGKRYFYLLEDIDTDGISTFHGPVKVVPRRWYGLNK